MGSTTWRGTGDFNFYDKKHPKQNNSISYPSTPKLNREETILSRVNSVEGKIEEMKELIKKLDEWENKPVKNNLNTKTVKSDSMSELDNNITKLKKEIVNKKQYLDLCVYDDALLNCLPEMPDLENVDSNNNPIGIISQSMLSNRLNDGKKINGNTVEKIHLTNINDSCAANLKLSSVKSKKKKIQQELLDTTSCGKKSLHCSKVASVESTRAVKSKKKKKKSVSVKNKKQKFANKSKNLNKNSLDETKVKSKTTMIKAKVPIKAIQVSNKNISNKYKETKSKYLEKPVKHEMNDGGLENIEKTNILLAPPSEGIGEFQKEVDQFTEPQYQFIPAHYAQSTVSSRMKQIDRSFYPSHDFKYPFVLGQSTNKSHNLGVNIQQILSLLKKKRVSNNSIIPVKSNMSRSRAFSVLTKTSRFYCPAIAEADEEINDEISDFKSPWERMQEEYEFVNIEPNKQKPRCICVGNIANRKYLRTEEDNKEESVLRHLDSTSQSQFNKVKSTSSVYWASVLRQIKQYKVNLESTLPKPSIPV